MFKIPVEIELDFLKLYDRKSSLKPEFLERPADVIARARDFLLFGRVLQVRVQFSGALGHSGYGGELGKNLKVRNCLRRLEENQLN